VYRFAGRAARWSALAAATLCAAGLYLGLMASPTDLRQGESHRILFVHIPAVWMSVFLYALLAGWGLVHLASRYRLAAVMARALAPTGALFAGLALWTGVLWSRPGGGAWWVWDVRLTSELILLFLYLGVLGLQGAIDDPRRADRASALLALVGAVDLPVIHLALRWWAALHGGAATPALPDPVTGAMVAALLVMLLAFWAYSVAASMSRARSILLEREHDAGWVGALAEVH